MKYSKEETIELFKRFNNGEEYVSTIIYNDNIKLVSYVINKYFKGTTSEREEYYSIALLAYWQAILNYDYTKNYAFSTYAIKYIKCRILKYIQRQKVVKRIIPESNLNVIEFKNNFEDLVSLDQVDEYINLENKETLKEIEYLFNFIPEKYLQIFILYFGFYSFLPLTYEKISILLNISKTYVRNLNIIVIQFIRECFNDGSLISQEEIIIKSKNCFKQKNCIKKSIFEYFPDIPEKAIISEINNLPKCQKELIYKLFGLSLKEADINSALYQIDESIINRIENGIKNQTRRRTPTEISLEIDETLCTVEESSIYDDLLQILTENEILLLFLKLNLYNGKEYSLYEIASYFKIKRTSVVQELLTIEKKLIDSNYFLPKEKVKQLNKILVKSR